MDVTKNSWKIAIYLFNVSRKGILAGLAILSAGSRPKNALILIFFVKGKGTINMNAYSLFSSFPSLTCQVFFSVYRCMI